MTIKASARSAMLFAAGILVSLAGSAPVIAAGADSATVSKSESATSDKSVRQGSRYLKKRYAHRKAEPPAAKSDERRQTEEKQVADASSGTPRAIPDWLTNANAQMTAADAPSDGAKDITNDSAKAMSAAMSEKANTVLQTAADQPAEAQAPAETGAAGSDQLNDLDRALHETPATATSATQSVVMASTSRPSSETVAQASNDSSTLDKTSMIGKIFIAVGALLTVASAARMFMA
ncbi:hypothetical protein [Bradyrhizobium sp. CB3481]|uniref:hypothetical protein n=1 Tax=Bradyrhizobium sp. CB3481 TaxID=3039158 RepID=UPI0024B1D27D|nr:hypothetical protein [Bradyrhizobium sp. CB3481]WFU19134.1 hypothetical protein QA643_12700 [Bradyrhizobium sp. CB3481]